MSHGAVVGRGDAAYETAFAAGGGAEQRPEDYLEGARRGDRGVRCSRRPIAGIGVVGQTPTLVLVGEDGEAVRPALTWQDTRAGEEAAELAHELGSSEPLFGTRAALGTRLSAGQAPVARASRAAKRGRDALGAAAQGLRRPASDGLRGVGSVVVEGHHARARRPACPPRARARGVAGRHRPGGRPGLVAARPCHCGRRSDVRRAGWHARRRGLERRARGDAGRRRVCRGDRVRAHRHVQHRRRLDTRCGCRGQRLAGDPDRVHAAARRLRAHAIRRRLARVARAGVARRTSRRCVRSQARRRSAGVEPPTFVPYIAGERAPIWRSDVAGAFFGLSTMHGAAALARACRCGRLLQRAPCALDRRGGRRARIGRRARGWARSVDRALA